MGALSRLEQIGISFKEQLDAYKEQLQSVIGIDEVDSHIDNSFSLLEMWVQGHASLQPTWTCFFWALKEITLKDLADKIANFLSGVAVEQIAPFDLDTNCPESEKAEGREEDEQEGEDDL